MLEQHVRPEVRKENVEAVRKPYATWWEALFAHRGVAAYIPIIIVNIAIFCISSWQIFLPNTDAARYQCYALTFWLGSTATKLLPAAQCAFLTITKTQPPLHMLPIEYPPLTLLAFSLPLLAPLRYYQMAFTLFMALISVMIYWLLLRYGPRGGALAFAFYLLVGALATAQGRFDLLPATFTLLCMIAAERKHWTAAYLALAIGVLLKLYPILLLPALFIAEQRQVGQMYTPPRTLTLDTIPHHLWLTLRGLSRWRWKNSLIFVGVLLGATLPFALLNFQGAVIDQLRYFAQRPIQIEATGSTFLWLATHFGFALYIASTYGSLNIISQLDGTVSFVGNLLFLAGCAYIFYKQWREQLDLIQTSIVLLLIFVATGKVFSPQYLIWIMPLLTYAGAFDAFWLILWGATSLLTTFIYTYLYLQASSDPMLIPYVPGFVETVSARNAFFVLVTLAYLFNWLQVRQRRALPPLITGKETRLLYGDEL